MNKFTRSQMGKIMAYALSAAMAVTVVPTYMMKPIIAQAAPTVNDKLSTLKISGSNYEVTVPASTEASAVIKFYVTTDSTLAGKTVTAAGTALDSTDVEGTAIADIGTTTATVTKTDLDAKATAASVYYVYYAYNGTATASADTDKLVLAGTITGQAAAVTDIKDKDAEATATFYNGDKIVVKTVADDITKAGVVALFTSPTATKKSEAKYLFDSTSNVSFDSETADQYSFYIPASVEAGSYYVGVFNEDSISDISSNASASKLENTNLIEVKKADIATGISLSTEKTTISYTGSSTEFKTNTETLTTTLTGGTKYTSVKYNFTAKDADGNDVTATDKFIITGATDNDEKTDSEDLPKVTVKAKDGIDENTTLECKVTMTVPGRKNPIVRTVTYTAKKDLNLVTGIVTEAEEYVNVGESTTVSVNKIPSTSNETLTYTFTSNISGVISSNVGTMYYIYKDNDGDGKYSESKDTLYASFDSSTGEVITRKAGAYKVKPTSENVSDGTEKTITALEFGFEKGGIVNGTVDGSLGNGVTEANLSNQKGYVTYTVEDPSIATINNSTVAFGTEIKGNALNTGITKVTANITVYGSTKTYNFTKDGYIVVAPKSTDKDFELTSVPNTEAYINGLQETSKLTSDLKAQVAEDILDGSIDASKLSATTYSEASRIAEEKYGSYYEIISGTSANEAVGLLFAAADDDVLSVEDPEAPVTVEYKVSALHEGDKVYKKDDSVVDFVAEMTVGGKVQELKKPIWLKVTDNAFENGKIYTVYDDGEAIYTAKAVGNTLTFQTDSFSVFSIVADPNGKVTDNTSKVEDPDETDDIYDRVNFSAHVQRRIGTDDEADIAATVTDDGLISLGTHGQSRRVEMITLNGLDPDSVEMTAHVQRRVDHPEDVADLTQVVNEDGSISLGTEHQSRRLEAFSMNLKGDLADQYDVYYRVHAQNVGWLGWAKNGELAGTSHQSLRLEEIEIVFVEKGTEFDASQYVAGHEDGDRGYLNSETAFIDGSVK